MRSRFRGAAPYRPFESNSRELWRINLPRPFGLSNQMKRIFVLFPFWSGYPASGCITVRENNAVFASVLSLFIAVGLSDDVEGWHNPVEVAGLGIEKEQKILPGL